MKKLILQALIACSFGAFTLTSKAMEPKKYVFTVDHDDVINTKEELGIIDFPKFLVVIGKIGWNSPRGAASLIWNWRSIFERGYQKAETTSGTSNIIYTLAQDLKKEGYPDLTPYVEEMTAITVKPKPIAEVIEQLKALKRQGYVIVGATNQDYYQNKAFRAKMAAQGVDVNQLFDSVLVGHTLLKESEVSTGHALVHELEPGIYMATAPKGEKPNVEYFQALKELAKKHAPQATTFVHTDDKLENVQGAQKVKGFAQSLHFKLPENKSARRCTKEELAATIAEWKSNIQKLQ